MAVDGVDNVVNKAVREMGHGTERSIWHEELDLRIVNEFNPFQTAYCAAVVKYGEDPRYGVLLQHVVNHVVFDRICASRNPLAETKRLLDYQAIEPSAVEAAHVSGSVYVRCIPAIGQLY